MMTMTRFVIGSWFFLLPSVGLEAAEPDGSWGQEEVLQGCFGSQEDWQEHRDLHWPGGLHSPLRDESPCPEKIRESFKQITSMASNLTSNFVNSGFTLDLRTSFSRERWLTVS